MNSIKRTFWTAAGLLGLVAILALPAAADQQILDDLIVDGSACIGLDCVNGESFGFDTLRLKENNLRINFADTSTSASFPSNDWRITINDSSNGGGNYFAVEDSDRGRQPFRIEGGAPANSLYVDDGGRIGFGTSTPVVDLHVKSGNTPTLRLEQDGSSGFGAQTWDLAGNEANFFIRDASNGSTLPFRIFPGAPSNSIAIAATGQVGLGLTTPDASLEVRGTGSTVAPGNAALKIVKTDGTGEVAIQLDAGDDGQFWNISHTSGDALNMSKSGTGNIEFSLSNAGTLTLEGDLITGGIGNCAPPNPACDGVFLPNYELESIDEHASFMWQNSYLPAVGPTAEGRPINLTVKTQGMLNELEKAHIYIEQLHQRLEEKEGLLSNVLVRLEALEQPE